MGFYDSNIRTAANSDVFIVPESIGLFPAEGLFIGQLSNNETRLPALLDLQEKQSFGFLYNSEASRASVNQCLENILWRIALSIPSDILRLTLFCGDSSQTPFATAKLLNSKLFEKDSPRLYSDWNLDLFQKRLNLLGEDVQEKVSLIRCSDKDTIIEYNEASSQESRLCYEFIFISDFPHGFDSATASKIERLARSGKESGVFVFISWDMNAEMPASSQTAFSPQALTQDLELIYPNGQGFSFRNSGHDEIINRFSAELNSNPVDVSTLQAAAEVIEKYLKENDKNRNRSIVKLDVERIANLPYEHSASEISICIGVDKVAKRSVELKFNSGDFIHAFILGQSGSGKSVLLNDFICSAILKYSPSDLMLYLMDFKGVEFNRYRGVKHAKAILVHSDMQIALEVLRELNSENKRRISLFSEVGVSKIDDYNNKNPQQRLPQILFVADECQVLFQRPKSPGLQLEIHKEINNILNTIATQGRSQGIHLLLATQQLDETDISGQILKNLTECILLDCAQSDSNKLVADSSEFTYKQATGHACYYHKKELTNRVQSFFADEKELSAYISMAQDKSESEIDNGCFYYCGSSSIKLGSKDIDEIKQQNKGCRHPQTYIGVAIGLDNKKVKISLRKDYSENILFFGSNKDNQTIDVAINALINLLFSYKQNNQPCNCLIIDCLDTDEASYCSLLDVLVECGLCKRVERQTSGDTLKELAESIYKNVASDTILVILGAERYSEIKRNLPLSAPTESNSIRAFSISRNSPEPSNMTFQQALSYILEEGPRQGVHTLLQVDKPGNILFEGDYGTNGPSKFKHKVILKSQNRYLVPLHLSANVDVEILYDEKGRIRAYYCPEDELPILFTPYEAVTTEYINSLI